MDDVEMRRRVAEARTARVGTVDQRGRVHLVPIVYVLEGETLYSSTATTRARPSGSATSNEIPG
jgi:nitroimidazol reductase NimA-like FMN-containing flavoprotein (pyridoxamine 5'-phosphate oxidase superfamily)